MARVSVWAGTTDGAYTIESDTRRGRWRRRGPYLKGLSVNHFAWDPQTRTLYAATMDDGVYATRTQGRTWTPLNGGLPIRKVWTLAVDPDDPDALWAGTHFSYLFKSVDRGKSWQIAPGYLEAPGKEGRYGDWGFGTTGNCLHTVVMDPRKASRMYVVSSSDAGGHGALRSDDGGKTWKAIQKGTFESCPKVNGSTGRPAAPSSHLANEHTCTHRLAIAPANPRILYRQMHCGVYRSANYGGTWRDISPKPEQRHGFPLAVHPVHADVIYVVPAEQGRTCTRHNSCIQGQLTVYRTRDAGRRWEPLREGLPADVHCVVLRHGMDTDALQPAGVYLGTTAGELYASADEGDAWARIASGLPRIQGVVALTT